MVLRVHASSTVPRPAFVSTAAWISPIATSILSPQSWTGQWTENTTQRTRLIRRGKTCMCSPQRHPLKSVTAVSMTTDVHWPLVSHRIFSMNSSPPMHQSLPHPAQRLVTIHRKNKKRNMLNRQIRWWRKRFWNSALIWTLCLSQNSYYAMVILFYCEWCQQRLSNKTLLI